MPKIDGAKRQSAQIKAEQIIEGIPVNPVLPKDFDCTPNEDRPSSHQKFWNAPYIVTESVVNLDAYQASRTDQWAEEGRKTWAEENRAKWMAAWPNGTRYTVRCLDGGAWDRSTWKGSFPSLEEAVAFARSLLGSISFRFSSPTYGND